MTQERYVRRTIMSVDPGISGALAWLTEYHDGGIDLLAVVDLPTTSAKVNGREKLSVSPALLRAVMLNPILPRPQRVILEEVGAMPKQGVTSMFRFGYVSGLICGVASGLDIPTEDIRPIQWQRAVNQKQGDDAGRQRALQLFPGQATSFARKMDHNRADAALIGYGWLKLNP